MLPVLQAVLSGVLVGGVYGLAVDRPEPRLRRDADRQFRPRRPGHVRHVCRRGRVHRVWHRSALRASGQLPHHGGAGRAAISLGVPPFRRPHHPQSVAGGDRPGPRVCKWWRSSCSASTRAAPPRSSPAATIWSGRSFFARAQIVAFVVALVATIRSNCCCAGANGARRCARWRTISRLRRSSGCGRSASICRPSR